MYSTCLSCHSSLGANEAVEPFPVGRRLAFDGERGRLWAVCPSCGRWNLSPLEERWEAVEACERLFRGEQLRVQTAQVGLARLREGTELIRVGRPQRPEMAAWRWGDALGARRRKALVGIGGGVAAGGLALGGLVAAGIAVTPVLAGFPVLAFWGVSGAGAMATAMRRYGSVLKVPGPGGHPLAVYRANLGETGLVARPEGGWALRLRHARGTTELQGEDALRALRVLMARVNPLGASSRRARDAAEAVAEHGGPERLLRSVALVSGAASEGYAEARADHRRRSFTNPNTLAGNIAPTDRGALPRLGRTERLALEMAVHEDAERRAMDGEMAALEAAWREAEEIAGIADGLLVPAGVEEKMAKMKGGKG